MQFTWKNRKLAKKYKKEMADAAAEKRTKINNRNEVLECQKATEWHDFYAIKPVLLYGGVITTKEGRGIHRRYAFFETVHRKAVFRHDCPKQILQWRHLVQWEYRDPKQAVMDNLRNI